MGKKIDADEEVSKIIPPVAESGTASEGEAQLNEQQQKKEQHQRQQDGNTKAALSQLRDLLLEAADLVNWYPVSEEDQLAKAAMLADDVPRLVELLEDAVVDVVMLDTAKELTRIELVQKLGSETQVSSPDGPDTSGPLAMDVPLERVAASYIHQCSSFEDELRRRYI